MYVMHETMVKNYKKFFHTPTAGRGGCVPPDPPLSRFGCAELLRDSLMMTSVLSIPCPPPPKKIPGYALGADTAGHTLSTRMQNFSEKLQNIF